MVHIPQGVPSRNLLFEAIWQLATFREEIYQERRCLVKTDVRRLQVVLSDAYGAMTTSTPLSRRA